MNYPYAYLNIDKFDTSHNEFLRIKSCIVNQKNAAEIGMICLNAVSYYKLANENIRREKSNLDQWIRLQRINTRSIRGIKGASSFRGNANAMISNTKDFVIMKINQIQDIASDNQSLAKNKLDECLIYVTFQDILDYQKKFLEKQEKQAIYDTALKKYKSNKDFEKNWLSNSIWALVLFFILLFFSVDFFISMLLSAASLIFIILASLMASNGMKSENQNLLKEIKSYEAFIRDFALEEDNTGQAKISMSKNINYSDDQLLLEIQRKEDLLAKILEKKIVSFDDACEHFKAQNLKNWKELARKILLEDPSLGEKMLTGEWSISRVDYTVDSLKSRFSSLQEAKAFYKLTARSWQSLADKLNDSQRR
jgi:hypothetical protein